VSCGIHCCFLFNPDAAPAPASAPATWQQQILARGWGYGAIDSGSIQPDNGAGLTSAGIITLMNKGQPRKPDDWGTLRAVAWGASRFLDYLETDKAVDAKQVGLQGISRYGKEALVTMAYDSRFAIAYVASSGLAGAGLYRRNFGELLANVAGWGEYHWMAGNFVKYGADPLSAADLPVDGHMLLALCAPRPVLVTVGTNTGPVGSPSQGDWWADPTGTFMAVSAAAPAYTLLGEKALAPASPTPAIENPKSQIQNPVLPPPGTALTGGALAFRQHTGGHADAPNWPAFLAMAARYFRAPVAAPPAPDAPPAK
jgi:hypothetical protein